MTTWIEDHVDITVHLNRSGADDIVSVTAQSWAHDSADAGKTEQVREITQANVTALLNAAQRASATSLLDAATNYAKSQWDIP
jgi:hypothetical protein